MMTKEREICINPGKTGSDGSILLHKHDSGFMFESIPCLALQILALSLVPRFIHKLLSPLNQPIFVSQLLGGILFSPWVIGYPFIIDVDHKDEQGHFVIYGITQSVFNSQRIEVLNILAHFSSMFFLFKVGLQMNPAVLKRANLKAYVIGLCCYFFSYGIGNTIGSMILYLSLGGKGETGEFLFYRENTDRLIAIFSMTSFPVVHCILNDLNMLNSEVGNLATSAAMIADFLRLIKQFGYLFLHLLKDHQSTKDIIVALSLSGIIIYILLIARPAALWMIKNTPKGGAVKELYISFIMVSVLLCGLASEFAGFNPTIGSFFLGLALPDGPPLGEALAHKLDYLITVVFMPLHIGIIGMKTDIHQVPPKFFFGALSIMIFCFMGKIVGVMWPAVRYFGVSRRDSFLLGLIVNLKGIVEIILLNAWIDAKQIDIATNTVIVLAFVAIAAVVTPMANYMYDPSLKFLAYKRRRMLQSKENPLGLHVLVCVHTQDDVPSIIKLLEASNPGKINPLKVLILHLVELVGRASPLLIAHPPHKRSSTSKPNESETIINAFQNFQQRNHKLVTVESYSTISPYASMHSDICSMSVDNKTSVIIFPFHTQDSLRNDLGRPAISSRNIKILFQNMLRHSPCTVGILIEGNNHEDQITSISPDMPYNVTVLFFGGPDDREALSFAMNMIQHPSVFVTVTRFFVPATLSSSESMNYNTGTPNVDYEIQKLLDDELIDHFRVKVMHLRTSIYKEMEVKDGSETIWAIRLFREDFDLMIVGRQQVTDSNIISGFDDGFLECEELGVIGDIVSSTDYKAEGSILIFHQPTDIN